MYAAQHLAVTVLMYTVVTVFVFRVAGICDPPSVGGINIAPLFHNFVSGVAYMLTNYFLILGASPPGPPNSMLMFTAGALQVVQYCFHTCRG